MELIFILIVDLLASLDRRFAAAPSVWQDVFCGVGPAVLIALSVTLFRHRRSDLAGLPAAALLTAAVLAGTVDQPAGMSSAAAFLALCGPAAMIAVRFASGWPWTPLTSLAAAATTVAAVLSGALLASQALLSVLVAVAFSLLACLPVSRHQEVRHASV